MSRTAIADVGETLIALLRENLSDLVADPQQIVLASPADAEERAIRLTLFLYSVVETAELKNEHRIAVRPGESRPAPLTLDLHYMLTGLAPQTIQDQTQQTVEAHRILGAAMRVLYDHGILKGSQLRGELRSRNHELRITLHPISNEDLTRIWTVFPDTSYKASVTYLVTPVRIESKRTFNERRVVERQDQFDRMVPTLEGV